MEKKRSATETLMTVMEDFGESEPEECIVIYTNAAGDLNWSATTDSVSKRVGLLEACKQFIIANAVKEKD